MMEQARDMLQRFFDQYQSEHILLLSSGGSALELMQSFDIAMPSYITFSVLDERWGESESRNSVALQKTPLHHQLLAGGAHVIDLSPEQDESREGLRTRFERTLKNWRMAHADGPIIVTMGMGPDGHTSGIFPQDNVSQFDTLFLGSEWVVSYSASAKYRYPERITSSASFLRDHVDHAIVVIDGQEKKEAYSALISESGTLYQTPARIMHEMKDVHLFTTL